MTSAAVAVHADELLQRIPDVNEVRARLANNQREAAVLRSLLKVAEKKQQAERFSRQARKGAADGR